MLHLLKTLLHRIYRHRYQRELARALALQLRGEVRNDGLEMMSAGTELHIEWRARDIHPWDRNLRLAPEKAPGQKASAFVDQALADTEAAIYRLFASLPQVDTIGLRVLDRESEHVILAGTVTRFLAATQDRTLSIGMRLRYMGVTYYSASSQ